MRTRAVVLTVLSLTIRTAAHAAGTIITPAVYGNAMYCQAVNVSNRPVSLEIRFFDAQAQNLGGTGGTPVPGQVEAGGVAPPRDTVVYCRVKVLDGSSRSVLVSLCGTSTNPGVPSGGCVTPR
jgi:hypothetical protein